MILSAIESRLVCTLTRCADHWAFPAFMAGIAFAATVSMAVPFGSLLAVSVLLAPRKWLAIALWSSLGAAMGAALLYLAFHHLGWARFFEIYPEVVKSKAWSDATIWLTTYGVSILFLIAALPLPLTPALMFAAISRLPAMEVLTALWLGKWLKYSIYAWVSSKFPNISLGRIKSRMDVFNAIHARVSAAGDTKLLRK
jgi:hypothetical protein